MGDNESNLLEGVSVVIPVYNGSRTIEELVQLLTGILRDCAHQFEIVLINDDSSDDSWQVIRQLASSHDCVRGINLMRNYGQHNALLCGILQARYSITITMDDDLQNPPEEIPKLLAKLQEGYDVVYGYATESKHSIWRRIASQMTRLALSGIMGTKSAKIASTYRCFNTRLREGFISHQGSYVFIDVLLAWTTNKFSGVRVAHRKREHGKSNYNIRKLIVTAINLFTGFSVLPLQIASLLGIVISIFGLVILFIVIIGYLVTDTRVPGFTFLASIISIFSGAQLLAIGIIGEYIGRVHFKLMSKPAFLVREYTEE